MRFENWECFANFAKCLRALKGQSIGGCLPVPQKPELEYIQLAVTVPSLRVIAESFAKVPIGLDLVQIKGRDHSTVSQGT